ncbi:MAG: ATP-dependent helicase [Oscillospiraceae bacterium]|nr:ATP-dependent helicase [Oscillospiraceae bacterium]
MDIERVLQDKHSDDKEQLDFIFSDEPRIIVTAPAGCGKTTAMISKIARELCVGTILGNKKVLAMTFSVNAAMRIKDAVKKLFPDIVDDSKALLNKVDIANYHNFAMRLLHKYGYILNSNFTNLSCFKIIDDSALSDLDLLFSTEKSEFKKFEDAIKSIDYNELCDSIDIYWNILNSKLVNSNIITYNGILVAAIKLLSIENISNFYSSYYQMIIIDEFQDTTLLGYLLMDKLIINNKAIFLGDDVQKIYGFLGAINDALGTVLERYNAKIISFKKNYRFMNNERMKQLDLFIRDYAENYQLSEKCATILLKKLISDSSEVEFISKGVRRILNTESNVAVLVRAGWQGSIIVDNFEKEGIPFFNALYSETDNEYIKFYRIAVEEFHKNVLGKAVQSALRKCLKAIKNRENEIYSDSSKKYVFDSLYKLLEKLFEISKTWEGTSKERYINIDFNLSNKGLKHMMEYLDEKVVLTTIHSSKGLEWDYVILPQMNAAVYPSWKHVCKHCNEIKGCDAGYDYCISKFAPEMKRKMSEEMSTYYVALTRAKKEVFFTVNTGLNQYGHIKKTNCLVNLPNLLHQDYEWDDHIK